MKNKAILIHLDYDETFHLLSDEDAGILIKAIFDYEARKTEPEFDNLVLTVVFKQIKSFLDSNRARYKDVCKKRSENAKKRWESLTKAEEDSQDMQMHTTTGNTNTNTNTNSNENSNVNSNENVCVKEKEKTAASEKTDEAVGEKISEHTNTLKTPYGEFFNVYLTAEEHTRLKQKLPDADMRIDSLSAYMKASGKIYADHYAQLLNWKLYENISPAEKKAQKLKPPGERREPTFDVSEFTKKALDIRYVPPKEE